MRIGFLILMTLLPLVAEETEKTSPLDYDSPAKLVLEGVPPSPSLHPGKRIWSQPRFTHWPAVIYQDERRNIAFELPVRIPGQDGSLNWAGGATNTFWLPAAGQTDRISGLVDLPSGAGDFEATFILGTQSTTAVVRVVDYTDAWPHAAQAEGFPVDADGNPVVLRIPRRDPERERQWALLKPNLPRPTGTPLLIGDPMMAMGKGIFDDLPGEQLSVEKERRTTNAIFAIMAKQIPEWPSTLVLSLGNDTLVARVDTGEEVRLLEALTLRAESDKVAPAFLLVLPPIPLQEHLRKPAQKRREGLKRQARTLGWTVLDAEELAGPATEANKYSDGVFTRYPLGEAQGRIRAALQAELSGQ